MAGRWRGAFGCGRLLVLRGQGLVVPIVIEIVADLVDYHGDSPRGEFWAAILAELE